MPPEISIVAIDAMSVVCESEDGTSEDIGYAEWVF